MKVDLDSKDQDTISTVQLCIFSALSSMALPSLRAICLDWKPKSDLATIVFFHDGEINDDLYDWYSTIEFEASCEPWGEYISEYKKRFEVISLKYPESIPEDRYTATLYHRKEPFEDPK